AKARDELVLAPAEPHLHREELAELGDRLRERGDVADLAQTEGLVGFQIVQGEVDQFAGKDGRCHGRASYAKSGRKGVMTRHCGSPRRRAARRSSRGRGREPASARREARSAARAGNPRSGGAADPRCAPPPRTRRSPPDRPPDPGWAAGRAGEAGSAPPARRFPFAPAPPRSTSPPSRW